MLYPDGTGVDKQESDDVLYVQDVQTGELFTIAPNRISELAEPTDPQAVIAEREEAIAAATNQEIEQEEGAASGTAAPTEAPEVRIPAPRFSGARVTLDLPNGSSVNGVVLQETDDGVEVQTDSPVNGRFVQVFPTDEFDGMLSSVRDEADDVIWSREVAERKTEAVAAPQHGVAPQPEKVDNQGNPLNEDGTLKVEKISSIDELTDEDFSAPTRNVQLPALPQNVDNAIGANGKPVIIKRNIFVKNWDAHKFPFNESRNILKSALYNTDLVGQSQPSKKPFHWVAIKLDEKSPIVVLEVNERKDFTEIVGWYTLDERNYERIKRQAIRNGGELVMLSLKDKVESLSTPHDDLSSESKDTSSSRSLQGNEGENAANGQQREMQGNGIPVDAKTGEPVYEAVAPDVAWDAIVQEAEGDEAMAMQVVTDMVADMEAKVQKAKKAKVRAGSSVREKLEAQKEHKRRIEEAEAQLEAWRRIAAVKAERIAAAERAKIEAAQQREVTQGDETEVPDFVFDKPENARERGYRMQNGQRADRQEPIAAAVGKEVSVKFTNKVSQPVRVAVVDARSLQPSHQNGQPNVLHFLPEAQPKKRTDHESVHAAEQIAAQMNPEEITSSVTAYTGAPSVNARGEVIQGNNRTAALKRMWQGYPEQAAAYKQYLMDHASEYGLNPEDIAAMEQPVLVNLMDVTDEQAIELGQYDVKDTESGGTERIKPRNVSQKMGDKAERFASILLRTTDEDASVSQLIDEHAVETLKWLEAQHYISPTQYRSAFNADGQVTPEAKNDLRGILYQAVFKNGSERLEDMFNALPTKAQRAILATAYRDFSTPESEKMLPEIQNSIVAFYELSQDAAFANAKNFEEARKATMAWLQQMQFDFSTGQSVSREGKYTNFALTLAAMYKVQTQTAIQQTFNDMFDLLQGRQQPDLYNPNPNNTPRTLAEAIREVLNIEYDGTNGSHALGGNNETRTTGRQGSARDDSAGGTDAPGNAAADAEGGTVQTDNERGRQRNLRHTPRREKNNLSKTEELKFSEELDQNGHPFILSSDGTTVFGEITKNSGLTAAPIKLNEGFNKTDEEGNNIGYGLLHIQAGHGQQILEAGYPSVQKFVEDVCRNYKEIRIGRNRKSNQTYMLLELHDEKHKCTLYVELSHDGTYWNVNSGGIFRNKYTDKNDIVWPEPTVGSNANTDTAEVANNPTEVAKGETVDRGGNSSQPISSESKDTPQNSAVQTSGQENAETSLQSEVTRAEQQTNAEPTEGQKEAGNYKKGRVKVGPFDVVIEQPRGSVRSGVDANGKAWETTMQNTYGYFGGTKGVDGDAIDVFLAHNLDEWDGTTVFVVDQYNPDGSFDEHKVMLGFNSQEEAEAAYFANYEADWAKTHRTEVTAVPLADFTEWVKSSKRKTKAFAEYKVAKRNAEIDAHNAQNEQLAEQLFSMAKEAETEKDFFDRAASLFEVTGYQSDLRDIYNGVKSGEIANVRALSFYTNATLKPVKAGVKVKAPKSEQKQKAEAPRLATKNGKAGEKPRKHAAQPGAPAVSTQEATLRDALVDVALQSGLEVVVDEKAQQVLDEVNGRARTMAFGEEYDYDRYPEGRVEPNIADKYVHIERAKLDHGFANFNEAKEWAKSHIVRTLDNAESGGKGNVKISSTAVNKYLSESAVAKSDSKDVHLAVLKKLPEIIHDSVDVETTPDFKKDENGVRKVGNEINKNVLIHRCYGAVEINGNIYRVKITLKEYKDKNEANKAYSYEATKIELFAGTLANDRKTTTDPGTNNSISVAKLLKDVEMSYRPGVKVLEESAKQRARLREHRYFRTPSGEAYGFTVDGKIYLDPRIATAETPIHEYAHLWADMIRNVNAEAWNDIVGLMKATPIWEEVRGLYPELKTDDEIADEVLAHYSGRRGAERLREAQQHAAAETGKSVFERAAAVAAIERVKQALAKFWQSVAELFHIRFTSAEEVADRVLADMLNGVNPNQYIKRKGKGVQKLHLNDKTLAGIHNITEEKLRKALNLGGLANPSLAIIDTAQNKHEDFGEISLIAPSALVDKETGQTAGTWTTDAYTQRYPEVERVMSEAGYKKFDKWVESLDLTDIEKAEVRRQTKEAFESNRELSWELIYLLEKGIDAHAYTSNAPYEWKQTLDAYSSADELLDGMQKDEELHKKVVNYVKGELSKPIKEKIRGQIRQQIKNETGTAPAILPPRYRKQVTEIFNRDYAKDLFGEDLMPGEEDVKKVMQHLFDLHNRTKHVDFSLSKSKASTYVHSHDLYSDYLRWQNKKLKEFGVKGRLFRGYSADGSRKYIPETLKNVSKAMVADAKGQTNGGEMVSLGSFVAKFADRVDSADEMRANKKRLATNESKQGFYSEWMPTYKELADELSDDIFAGEQRLHDIAVQDNPVKYAKKEYGITLSKSFMDKLNAFKKAIREDMTSSYFETKFERPVYLNEFAAAVIPSDLSEDVKGGLEKSGIAIYEYDPKIEGDRDRATNAAFEADNRIRFQFVGQQGAAALDKAEEATTRLDNLGVAREMERQEKDAKAIKLATGWERGGDGKWRYEVQDFDVDVRGTARRNHLNERLPWGKEYDALLDKVYEGEPLTEAENARLDELMSLSEELQNTYEELETRYLDDYVKDRSLFDAYPELKQVRVEMFNDPTSGVGATWYNESKLIRINEAKLENNSLQSLLAHEVQHAIQHIEGFAMGGNSTTYREHLAGFREKYEAWSVIDEFEDKSKELGDDARPIDVYNALVREYQSLGLEFGDGFAPSREAFDKGFNLWTRGYDNEGYEDAYNEYQRLMGKFGSGEYNNRYDQLAGEVEARNVQKRLHMTPEERRQSLAEETEDVAREDQIFIMENVGGGNASQYSSSSMVSPLEMSDAEKYERGERLRNAPAVDVASNQIVKTDTLSARKAAEKWWAEHASSPLHYQTEIGEVVIDKNSIGSSLAHRYGQAKLDAITSLKDGFKNAVYLGSLQDFTRDGQVYNHYFAYPIQYNGERCYVFCRALHDANKNHLYVHEVFVASKIEKGNTLQTAASQPHGGIALYKDILANVLDAAKVAENSETSQGSAENNFREGKGELSDDMLSYLNDPMAQMMGKPRGTKKQRAQFAERERGRMQAHAQNLVERLHLPNVEIVTDASQLEGKQRTAKGFYNKRTGKITIVLPNHASTADVEQTLLHEAVAHYGLRQLFGEHFDDFLDMVYRNAEEGIRRKIAEASAKHGWNVRTATEEYLADLAERTDFEHASPQWWAKIKGFFLDMLRGLGFEAMDGQTLTDNELRYVLWRSYENLTEPGKYPTFIAEARDVAKQHALQVGRFAPTETAGSRVAENEALSEEEMSEILFRDGSTYNYTQVLARDRYERRIKSGMYQTKEALQDSMLGLRTAMESILEAEGRKGVYIEDIDGFENAYLGENRLSSVNQAEAEKFAREQFKVSSKKVCGCNIWVRQNVVASYVLVIGKR